MAQRNHSVSLNPGKSRAAALTITHPNAAGIDIGSASHWVAVGGISRGHTGMVGRCAGFKAVLAKPAESSIPEVKPGRPRSIAWAGNAL